MMNFIGNECIGGGYYKVRIWIFGLAKMHSIV